MRESTTRKSLEVQERIEARAKQNQDRRKKKTQGNVLTQKELLEEAKLTEIENLKSLEMFQRLELEKKKNKATKKTFTGPMIRYHSVAMPSIEVIEEKDGKEENKTVGQYSRNFITFTDQDTMKEIFNYEKPEPVTRSRCVVTGLPARYFDPLTKQPFFNCTAFRIIREAYYRQVEKKVNPELPHVAKWLEWRENVKAA
ncbi:Vacuolar protein sorting-associated protein 72-like protein, partial [Stegodyphus mimosarum]